MFILKVKGTARIPDYVQLRDDDFTLLAYFRVDRPEKALARVGLSEHESKLLDLIRDMPYGKMEKLDI
ncbi:MAG: fructose-6-phosphate aldolase [Bacteroidia bacterium]|nr:fructose-6-phosphate aldolase [Bacteroidia bacterium]